MVLLPTSMVRVLPSRVWSVNPFGVVLLLTLWIVPVKCPRCGTGVPDGGVGNCEIVTPFVAPRFMDRSGWMMVSKWMSSLKARGELADKVTGKGGEAVES